MASGCVSTPIRWEQANFLSSSLPVKGIKHRLRMMMRNTNLNEDMMVTGHGFELRSEGQLAIEGYLQLLKYWQLPLRRSNLHLNLYFRSPHHLLKEDLNGLRYNFTLVARFNFFFNNTNKCAYVFSIYI